MCSSIPCLRWGDKGVQSVEVSMTVLKEVYPKEVIERCLHQSQPWSSKQRRVRASTGLALVLLVPRDAQRGVGVERLAPLSAPPRMAQSDMQRNGHLFLGNS